MNSQFSTKHSMNDFKNPLILVAHNLCIISLIFSRLPNSVHQKRESAGRLRIQSAEVAN